MFFLQLGLFVFNYKEYGGNALNESAGCFYGVCTRNKIFFWEQEGTTDSRNEGAFIKSFEGNFIAVRVFCFLQYCFEQGRKECVLDQVLNKVVFDFV